MPDWRHLWVQRKRWQRGALENLSAYGITRATMRYWGQQVGIAYGAIALSLAIVLMVITALSVDEWVWFPFWTIIGMLFLAERVLTAWAGGWRARLLALALVPELLYDLFLQAVFFRSLFDIMLDRAGTWGHVTSQSAGATA
jgi:poly-beta-1,6-N-acetyl-D-glucosamine synthase